MGARHFVNKAAHSYIIKNHIGLRLATAKKLSQGPIACLFHLPLQAFVATIMKLKARAGTIFRNCEKSNDGNPQKR